jgi:hypothetical protein
MRAQTALEVCETVAPKRARRKQRVQAGVCVCVVCVCVWCVCKFVWCMCKCVCVLLLGEGH